ncbi:MAG: hypothetical protein JJT81_18175, partial [Rubellimicrobium sp.]|nr:hypothetical protein [Rubellimicrobium sp.]
HPFFAPGWRRVAIVVFCFGWAGVEFAFASPTWGMIVAVLGAYCVWQFFFVVPPPQEDASGEAGGPEGKG